MKKLIALLLLFTLCSSTYFMPTRFGEEIEAAVTTDVTVTFTNMLPATNSYQGISITVHSDNADSIRFAVGTAAISSDMAWPPGSKIPMVIANSSKPLHYKANATGDKFTVTQTW